VHRSRIDRLDVSVRSIFSSPAIFKREALLTTALYKDLLVYNFLVFILRCQLVFKERKKERTNDDDDDLS